MKLDNESVMGLFCLRYAYNKVNYTLHFSASFISSPPKSIPKISFFRFVFAFKEVIIFPMKSACGLNLYATVASSADLILDCTQLIFKYYLHMVLSLKRCRSIIRILR